MNKDYHYIYGTVNNLDGKLYIGVHSTDNLEDGYMGSGVRLNNAIKKYGKENFTTTILGFYNSREEALDKEAYIVDSEFIKLDWTYNVVVGGYNGLGIGKDHPLYGIRGKDNPNYGSTRTEKSKEKMSEWQSGKNGYWFGKKMSKESSIKKSKSLKGRVFSEEAITKMSESKKGKYIGSNNPNAKKVEYLLTGEVFNSLKEGCDAKGLKYTQQKTAIRVGYKTKQFNYIE